MGVAIATLLSKEKMKSAIKYKSLEKILKKHLGNSKSLYINVGRIRSTRRNQTESKNYGSIELFDNRIQTNIKIPTGYFL